MDPENDCKTILTKDKKGKKYAFFLPGNMEIDFNKVSYNYLKKEGSEPGAICPFLLGKIPLFVDRKVFEKTRIQFGSGSWKFGLEIASKDLGKVIDFEIVSIAKSL